MSYRSQVVGLVRLANASLLIAGSWLACAAGFAAGRPTGSFAIALAVMVGVFGLTWLVGRALRPGGRILLALASGSVIAGLYAAELLLETLPIPSRFDRRELRRQRAAEATRQPFDVRTPLAVAAELSSGGAEVSVPVTGAVLRGQRSQSGAATNQSVAPLAGMSDRITVFCNEPGPYLTFRSDPYGFRNPAHVWSKRPVEVAVVGDSYAQGYCVTDDEEPVGLIRRRYPATVGLGVGGTGPLSRLAVIREYLTELRPPDVIWFHYEGNDLSDLELEKVDPVLPRYLEPEFRQNLMARQTEIDQVLTRWLDGLRRGPVVRTDDGAQVARPPWGSRLGAFLTLYEVRRLLRSALDPGVSPRSDTCCDLPLYRRVLREATAATESWGGQLHLVYLPAWDRYGGWVRNLDRYHRDEVLAAAAAEGLAIADLDSVFRKSNDPTTLWRYQGSHYSPRGFQLVAETVLAHLQSRRRARSDHRRKQLPRPRAQPDCTRVSIQPREQPPAAALGVVTEDGFESGSAGAEAIDQPLQHRDGMRFR